MDNHYKQVSIQTTDAGQNDILIALLAAMGYDGFEETVQGIHAFIPASSFDEAALQLLVQEQSLTYSLQDVAPQNWNALWESGFEPVVVADFAAIRASFHAPNPTVQYEIVITPKMSFGTGHHATTYMMVQQMATIDFAGKQVLDFGTGTGVLAILAEKMGAANVLGIDNDDWSINNALENVQANHCQHTAIKKAEAVTTGQLFDVVLANINLNVIVANLSAIAAVCKPGAYVLLSGFLPEDEAILTPLLQQHHFQHITTYQRKNWLCIGANSSLNAGSQ